MSDSDLIPTPRRHGYDPNQPRVPAGGSTGGQWTDADGNGGAGSGRKVVRDSSGEEAWSFFHNAFRKDGSLAEQVVFNRDRSRIISEFGEPGGEEDWQERHTVISPDGSKFTFENDGDTQTVYDADGKKLGVTAWTDHGPEAQPFVQQALFPLGVGVAAAGIAAAQAGRIAAQKAVEAALVLFTWLSSRNTRDRTAAFSLSVDDLRSGNPNVRVDQLTDEQLNEVCKQADNVQRLTDKAATDARSEPKDWRPSAFGTAVHTRVARQINGEPPEFTPDKPRNKDFRAEMSEEKIRAAEEADAAARGSEGSVDRNVHVEPETADPNKPAARYGQRNTLRVDAFEYRAAARTVCVYDIKTGERVLPWKRMEEIGRAIVKRYPYALRFIIIEVRPRR